MNKMFVETWQGMRLLQSARWLHTGRRVRGYMGRQGSCGSRLNKQTLEWIGEVLVREGRASSYLRRRRRIVVVVVVVVQGCIAMGPRTQRAREGSQYDQNTIGRRCRMGSAGWVCAAVHCI